MINCSLSWLGKNGPIATHSLNIFSKNVIRYFLFYIITNGSYNITNDLTMLNF